ncbi:MAG TPA: hypothetical protein VGJ60_29785 [Chloroflexota bacterium]|jgi:hypothetical protein
MTAFAAGEQVGARVEVSNPFQRFGGVCGVLAGVGTLGYAIAFILLANVLLSSLALLATGLLGTVVLVALYERVRGTDASFALWALVLGLAGALGAALHGGFDLAGALHPYAIADPNAPSAIDPRGLLTFGASGIGLGVLAWLIVRGNDLPRGVGYLGYLVAALQIFLYLGRLIVLDATSPVIVVPALLAGFIVTPIWYAWLGVSLFRGARP